MKVELFVKQSEVNLVFTEITSGSGSPDIVRLIKTKITDDLGLPATGRLSPSTASATITVLSNGQAVKNATRILVILCLHLRSFEIEDSLAFVQAGSMVNEYRLTDPAWFDYDVVRSHIAFSGDVLFIWTDMPQNMPPWSDDTPTKYDLDNTKVCEQADVYYVLRTGTHTGLPTLREFGRSYQTRWYAAIEAEQRRHEEEERRRREQQRAAQALRRNPHRLLYLDPSCPDWLVEIYWKAVVRALHPDGHPDASPEVRERLTKMVAVINEGHDLIKSQRGDAWQPALPWKKEKKS